MARGVEMEAESVKDQNVAFHVFVYNVQPGINIDYRTGENEKAADFVIVQNPSPFCL